MDQRDNIKRECCAVTSVIGASLVIFIVATAISSFVLVGMPYINDMKRDGNFQDLEVLCSVVVDNIDDITVSKPGEQRAIPFTVDKGLISTNKDEYDQTIIMYTNNSDEAYDFNVTQLEDGDHQFNIIFNPGVNYGQFAAHIHWIYGDLVEHREDVAIESNGIVITGKELTGTIEIFINDTNNHDNPLVGKIWLFDSNFLNCELNSGDTPYEISIEKGGLIYTDNQQKRVERSFNLDAEDDYLQIKIVQLMSLESFSISGSNVHTKISANSIINDLREMKRLYFIKLQFYGNNAQTWINYIDGQYSEFVPIFDSNTLFYAPSNPSINPNGVWVAFSNSLIEFNVL